MQVKGVKGGLSDRFLYSSALIARLQGAIVSADRHTIPDAFSIHELCAITDLTLPFEYQKPTALHFRSHCPRYFPGDYRCREQWLPVIHNSDYTLCFTGPGAFIFALMMSHVDDSIEKTIIQKGGLYFD